MTTIVGPFCVYKIRLGRRTFVLFGENHWMAANYEAGPGQIAFEDFIEDVFRKHPRKRYDLFIESSLKPNIDMEYRYAPNGGIPRLLRRFLSRPLTNVKVHNMDARKYKTVVKQDQTLDDRLLDMMEMYADQWHSYDDPSAKKEFFQNYKEHVWMQPSLFRVLMLRTLLTHPRIRKQFQDVPPKIRAGIYTECFRIMDESVATLTTAIRKAGLSDHQHLKKMPSTLTDDLYMDIVESASDIFCTVMDLYSLGRFFKKTTGPTIIVYAGAVHIWNYVRVLTALGGKMQYENVQPDDAPPIIHLEEHVLGKTHWVHPKLF